MHELVASAEALSAERLVPQAAAVEAAGRIPESHLRALADAGLHGLIGPREAGGAGGDMALLCAVAERLAAGCLSTAFVWIQHHGAVGATAATTNEPLRERFLGPLCRGEVRAGVAFSALRRPGPPAMSAERTADEDWRLDGHAPWVTGFDQAGVLRLAARDGEDVVWLLADAARPATLRTEPVHPVAVEAADTVTLQCDGHVVPADRLLGVEPYADWLENDRRGGSLRVNGSLALGLARRCLTELGEPIDPVDDAREALDTAAGPEAIATARAAASDLALLAARRLVVVRGGSGVIHGEVAERSAREAVFLLVFGQSPGIRTAQVGNKSVNPGRV